MPCTVKKRRVAQKRIVVEFQHGRIPVAEIKGRNSNGVVCPGFQSSGWLVQQVPDTAGQLRRRHRLLDEMYAGIQPSLMNNRILRVTGHEENLDSRLESLG